MEIKFNEILCKYAYNDATEHLARSAAFATSRSANSIGSGRYLDIAEELFRRDMTLLALSLRRLAELTYEPAILKQKQIKITQNSITKNDNIHNIIGNLIHGSNFSLLKNIRKTTMDINEIINSPDREIDIIFSIKNEKFPSKFIKSVEFLEAVNESLDEFEDILADGGVYVGTYSL
ncbi:hypothetical protein [Martelella sp. AMO21009]